jgi:hypothetical protein
MLARLLACPSCARHIRVDEERCPFCGATCPDTFASTPALPPSPAGLNRAELRDHARTAVRVTAAVGSGMAMALALSCCEATYPAVLYGGPPVPVINGPTDAAAGDGGGAQEQ